MMRLRIFFCCFALVIFACKRQAAEETNKKVFKYNQPESLTSLDPAYARNQGNIWAITQLYNGLVELDAQLQPSPSIAHTWEISPDGRRYLFHLRQDVYFHDDPVFENGKGRRVTASDFVYSFKRILEPRTASTGSWIFKGKVLEDSKGKVVDSCFKALNDSILIIYLKEPFIPFLGILSMPYAFVVPKEGVTTFDKDFRSHPIGTGPFLFKSWVEDNDIIFHKNPRYWKRDTTGNRMPYLDAVQISFIND
ncbi:MAG: ABC transporter substrate-binding protein, partial [Bacteroidota bacterium]|nr:ABC transporter substrate-binding protein [Bacteroidota bacterium]